MKKIILAGVLTMGLVGVACAEDWPDLLITNHTSQYSTSLIHNEVFGKSICSSTPPPAGLGSAGRTNPNSSTTITNLQIRFICWDRPPAKGVDCNADVYLSDNNKDNCNSSGKASLIANVKINTKTGITNVTMLDTHYTETHTNSSITVTEPGFNPSRSSN